MSSYEANGRVIRQHKLLDVPYTENKSVSEFSINSLGRTLYHFASIFIISLCIYLILQAVIVAGRFTRRRLFQRQTFAKLFDVENPVIKDNTSNSWNKVFGTSNNIPCDTSTVPELIYSTDQDSNSSTTASPNSVSPNLMPYSPSTMGSKDIYAFSKKAIAVCSNMDDISLKAK